MTRRADQNGSVLIITLWTVAILSLLAIGAGRFVWVESRLNALEWDRLRESRLMQGAMETVKRVLADHPDGPYALKDAWSANPDLYQRLRLLDGSVSIRCNDEQARLNLNQASAGMLRELLGPQQDALASSILQWRADSATPVTDEERLFYANLPAPYAIKRAPFQSLEEVLMVRGMTPELWNRLKPWVTVYTDGLVNINTAPAPVLRALGLDVNLVDRWIGLRRGPDGLEGTADDAVLADAGLLGARLGESGSLSAEQLTQISAARPMLTTRSRAFRLQMDFFPGEAAAAAKPSSRCEWVMASTGLARQWTIRYFSRLF